MSDWEDRVQEEVRGLARLVSAVLALEQREGTAAFARHAAAVLGRLRRMYFLETGAMGFLRIAAGGRPAPESERRRLRADHGGFDAQVERSTEALRQAARRHDLSIGREALALLAGMVEDRTCIRDSIMGMLSSYGGPLLDAQGRQDDAAFILERLEALAERFHEAEARLRLRAAERARATAEAAGGEAEDAAQDPALDPAEERGDLG